MSQTQVKQALGSGVVIEAVQSLTGAESIAPDHMGRSRQSAVGYVPQSVNIDPGLLRQVELLLTRQAVLLDARRWSDWMETFTEDGIYWMPAAPEQTDWASQPSIFAEDRLLMEVRANRLMHPNAWSQAAQWATHHLLGAVIVEQVSADALSTYTPFQMMEVRRDKVRHFGGSYRHHLVKQADGQWKIRLQRVDMFNAQASYDYVIQAWV
jgi:3-phenylpropionate/cinnamic acid dioxygenase small subunit